MSAGAGGGDYSKINKLLLIAGLVYFLWPQIRQALSNMGVQVPDLSKLLPVPSNYTTAGVWGEPVAGGASATGAPGGGAGGGAVKAIAGGASTVAGAASAAGASALTIGLATGIGAVAIIVAWGVIKQGWFRGGQEGVVVNPARDQFLALFASLDYMRDARNPPGFYGLAWLLANIAPGNEAPFLALTKATKKDQLESAVSTIQALLSANRAKSEQLWEYARRDTGAPQRAVTSAAA